jgi:hypothetical protein
VFTRQAQQQGINVIATRREDREHLRADILTGRAPLRENQKYNVATKQTRQGRTFEVRAPSWYAEHGLDYERRRLAAAAAPRGAEGQPTAWLVGQGSRVPRAVSEKGSRGLLARLFGRSKSAEEAPRPSRPQNTAKVALKRGGYYENFVNYRKDAKAEESVSAIELANDKERRTRERETAEKTIDIYFMMTHRDPDKAGASFRAMFRESPRLALWAAAKHPQAFGEPSGGQGLSIAWRAVRAIAPTEKQQPAWRIPTRDPLDREAALAGERLLLRQATERVRAKATPEEAKLIVVRSLSRLADQIERETATDSLGKEQAADIRHVVRTLTSGDGATQTKADDQAERMRGAADEKDKATLYRELEERLRQRDQVRPKGHPRDRNDGGRDR